MAGGMGGGTPAETSAGTGEETAVLSPFPTLQPLMNDSGGEGCSGSSFVSPAPPTPGPLDMGKNESVIIDGCITDVGSFVDSLFVAGDVSPALLPHVAPEWFGA